VKIIYSDQPVFKGSERSIFLVGPTPRSVDVPSWRPDAIHFLGKLGYDGVVLVPEPEIPQNWDYLNQVNWEYSGLSHCSAIAVWVPRELARMPAFTTNVEFGFWLSSSANRLVYGRPEGAPHTGYLDWLYYKITMRNPHENMVSLLEAAMKLSG
jgi:hypothetical protein